MKQKYVTFVRRHAERLVSEDVDTGGKLPSSRLIGGPFKVAVNLLEEKIVEFVDTMDAVFTNVDETPRKWNIEEVTLNIEVNASGDIRVLSGGLATGIAVVLKRASRIEKQDDQ